MLQCWDSYNKEVQNEKKNVFQMKGNKINK